MHVEFNIDTKSSCEEVISHSFTAAYIMVISLTTQFQAVKETQLLFSLEARNWSFSQACESILQIDLQFEKAWRGHCH
jgi:hypothetical protein